MSVLMLTTLLCIATAGLSMSPEQVRECMSEYDVDNGKLGTTLH